MFLNSYVVQMPTKIFCYYMLLLAAFAGGVAFLQAFSCERARCVENSEKLCGWHRGEGWGVESSVRGEAERPLLHKGPGGPLKRNEEPSKDLLSAKGHGQLYLLGP